MEREILEERAKKMRQNMTPQEGKLWHLFLKRYPVHFRRQVICEGYILDFFCPYVRLAVEIDGDQHGWEGRREYDAKRTRVIEEQGIEVIRFTNQEIDRELARVKECIHEAVQQRLLERR